MDFFFDLIDFWRFWRSFQFCRFFQFYRFYRISVIKLIPSMLSILSILSIYSVYFIYTVDFCIITYCVSCVFSAPCFQIGQVLADAQLAHFDYGQDSWGLGQPHFRVVHHYLHLRRHGDATLWQKLYW